MDFSKAVELIKKSERIALLLPEEPNLDCLAAVETLARVLAGLGKTIGFIKPTHLKDDTAQKVFTHIASSPLIPKEFIVSLATISSPIAQLRYEKGEDKIDVVFSPKMTAITQDAVSFRDGLVRADAGIAVGISDIDAPPYSEDHEFYSGTPIINIDNSEKNKYHSECNLIDAKKNSLSEIVYELVTGLGVEHIDKDLATILFAAVANTTQNFNSSVASADAFAVASEFIALGADQEKAFALARTARPVELLQFLGRAAVRSKFEPSQNIFWSFLTPDDFEKTGRTADDIPDTIDYLKQEAPQHRALAVLSQHANEHPVHAMLSANPELLETIKIREGGEFHGPHLALSQEFPSFKDAEDYIASLLEEVL